MNGCLKENEDDKIMISRGRLENVIHFGGPGRRPTADQRLAARTTRKKWRQ